ncbi:MAG: hypothetical protein ABJE47_02505 [bacterium]
MINFHPSDVKRPEGRWPAVIGTFAAVALHFALPESLRVGPPWLIAGIVSAIAVAAAVARARGRHALNNILGYTILGILTAVLLWSVARLLLALVHGHANAIDLLRSATVIWVTNVVVFATVYWRLDAGGPNARERREAHTRGAFLFPQMTLDATSGADKTMAEEDLWRPHYVDYLFVAFNTSTAFSPTDAPVLSMWAKLAMMVQAGISFSSVVLIAARAVNTL